MTERRYDEFRVTLSSRDGGDYDVQAIGVDGAPVVGTFRLPLGAEELERTVVRLAHDVTRRSTGPGIATRGLRPVEPAVVDAEHLGGALNDALLAGDLGAAYDAARNEAGERGRGLRLTLSLAGAPALLGVPWELLYRRPRFLANQRRTPLVRHLDVGSFPPPPPIEGSVRILGIVASPQDCAPLDVDEERARVEAAVASVVADGRVELDWLEPATPRRLREALRDGVYHVIHYVGHSDFTSAGEGVLFLESAEGAKAEVDGTELANLLADQEQLRLVVLNSCEGARTSLTDPFAGVATTLVQLGVPAVVAMQFEISDTAAILFAEELYTNLIARQAPVDAAVSEARKAIYIEQAGVEWATPVLFMGDTDVDLFDFRRAAIDPDPSLTDENEKLPSPYAALPPPPAPTPPVPGPRRSLGRRRSRLLVLGILAVVLAAAGIGVLALSGNGDDDDGDDTAPVTTAPAAAAAEDASAATAPSASDPPPVVSLAAAPPPTATNPPATHFVGEITTVGQVDRHAFDAEAGDIVYLAGSEPCGDQRYWVETPSGAMVGYASTCSDGGRHVLAESGQHAVLVDSNGGLGAYDVTLTRVPPDVVQPVPVDDRVAGEIDVVGAQHRWTFEAAARDIVYLAGSEPCGNQRYWVETMSGSVVGYASTCSDGGRHVLAESGQFAVVVDSNGGIGAYDLRLIGVPTDVVQEVPVDGRVVGEIDVVGAQHRWTFEAVPGATVSITGSEPCGDQRYWVETPSGAVVGYRSTCSDSGPDALAERGQYEVVIDSNGATGAYDLTVVTS